jgi:hypothetical protein
MDSAPVLKGKADGGSWALWEKLAPAIRSSAAGEFQRPYRGVEVGVVHHDSPRPGLLSTDQAISRAMSPEKAV